MKVLVIEDSPEVVETISLCFRIRWPELEVISTSNGSDGIDLVESESPDIVILDIGLPDIGGFDVLRQIRLFSDVPIIILTVMGEEVDKVKGFDLGADDYVTKPFKFLEFLARVKSAMDHHYSPRVARSGGSFDSGGLHIDFASRRVSLQGKDLRLTPTEYELLYHLAQNAGRVVPARQLLQMAQGPEYADGTENLKVYIRRLRAKIEDDPSNPRFILTQHGVGYRFAKPDR